MPLLAVLFFAFVPCSAFDTSSDSLRCERFSLIGASDRPDPDPWFSADKFLHFYFSASITGFGYHACADQMGREEGQVKVISVSLTALLGLGKELYDKKKKNLFSWKDLAWDGLGIVAGYFLFIHL